MTELEILKDKIEILRDALVQAIDEDCSKSVVYEKSIALDKVLEEYYELEKR